MTTQHSPTPWRLALPGDRLFPETCTVVAGDEYHVAITSYQPYSEHEASPQDEANAAFIVRAVNNHADLLAALRDIEQMPCLSALLDEDESECGCAHCRARAAIAAAQEG